jgi:hypothetical protein
MSRPHTHPSAHTSGPCFRTDADGNIPLSRDWSGLLTGASALPLVVLQTRNTYARLVTLAPFPELAWSHGCGLAQSKTSDLTLQPSRFLQAHARIAHCNCCGSVGRIQIFDTTGAESLQLCAHPDTEPAAWARFLTPFAAPLNATLRTAPHGHYYAGLPFETTTDTTLHDTSLLSVLLELFSAEKIPFACTLHSSSVTQHRDLTPRRVSCRHGLLTIADGVSTLQITLAALRHLAVRPRRIDLIGLDGTSLVTLRPTGTPDGACLWSATLQTAISRI